MTIKKTFINLFTGKTVTEKERDEQRQAEVTREVVQDETTGEEKTIVTLPSEYEHSMTFKYFEYRPHDRQLYNEFIEEEKHKIDRNGKSSGILWNYRYLGDKEGNSSYGVIIIFKPVKKLVTINTVEGEEFGGIQEFIPKEPLGKPSYIFIDYDNLRLSVTGATRLNKPLSAVLEQIHVDIDKIMSSYDINSLKSVKKLIIKASNAEALLSDPTYKDIFKPLEFFEAKEGEITVTGDIKIPFITNLISYLSSAGESGKPVSKIKVTGQDTVTEKSQTIDVYAPVAERTVGMISKSQSILDNVELRHMAVSSFIEILNESQKRPVYENSWMDHATDIEVVNTEAI